MKLTTTILAMAVMAGGGLAPKAGAQNTDAIDQARSVAKSLQQKQANDSNAALDAAGVSQTAKPAPGAPSPAVKPAVIPASKPVAAAPAAKPAAAASSANNQLEKVNVVQGSDSVQVEITSSATVTPRVSKLDSPARILVELPGTVDASSKNHVAVGIAGVKGVRIGMDGKTPPTTSVVVDLDKACTYELTPGAAGKLVLTLHTQAVAKNSPAPATTPAPAAKVAVAKTAAAKPASTQTASTQTAAKPAATQPAAAQVHTVAKSAAVATLQPAVSKNSPPPASKPVFASKPPVVAKATAKPEPAKKQDTKDAKAAPSTVTADADKLADVLPKAEPKKEEDKKWAMSGKRDPFFSPVVQQQGGSGCSTGKKCLEIGNINLRGVVKSDNGFIAVVTNSLNKAYFLRENDPVFNGYVMKITGDSVVFQETVQDKLGKPFTREVVKRIFTPAV
jgi:Tfp pilus assembly protein PilP